VAKLQEEYPFVATAMSRNEMRQFAIFNFRWMAVEAGGRKKDRKEAGMKRVVRPSGSEAMGMEMCRQARSLTD